MIETAVIEEEVEIGADEGLRIYEIGYMLVPTKKEEEVEGATTQIRAMIEKVGGRFLAEGAPTLQRLAYLISVREQGERLDHDRGYF